MKTLSCFVVVVVSFFPLLLSGADTLLVHVFENEFRINNIVLDEDNNVYFSDRRGVFLFKDNVAKLIDESYSDVLKIENGKLTYFDDVNTSFLQKKIYFESQPKEWLNYIPSNRDFEQNFSVLKRGTEVFVAFNNFIYHFEIIPYATRHLKGASVRILYSKGNDVFAGTYSGAFKGDSLLTDCFMDGFIHEWNNQIIFSGGESLFYYSNAPYSEDKKGFFEGLDFYSLFNTSNWNYTGLVTAKTCFYFATDKGLFSLDTLSNEKKVFFDQKIIHNLIKINEYQIFVCVDDAVYVGNQIKGFKKLNIGDIGYPNDIIVFENKIFISSNRGIYQIEHDLPSSVWKLSEIITTKKLNLGEFYQIEIGIGGYLWISSTNGLLRLNPQTKNYNIIYDGFEFNKRASFNTGNKIYFGGLFGYLELDLQKLLLESNSAILELDSIKLVKWKRNYTSFLLIGLVILALIFLYLTQLNKFRKQINPTEGNLNNQTEPKDTKLTQIPFVDLDPIQLLDFSLDYIKINLNSVTVTSLAEYLGVSERTLSRKLEMVGKTPGELIREARLELIKAKILENPEISMENLSKITGYSSNHLQNLIKEL